jgi:hypothetical protein
MGQGCLDDAERAEEVGFKDVARLFFLHLFNRAQDSEPGIVHDHIDASGDLPRLCHDGNHFLGMRNVQPKDVQPVRRGVDIGLPVPAGTDNDISLFEGGQRQIRVQSLAKFP